MRIALVHYHEIGLKGRNRGAFERRLQSNLRWALRDVTSAEAVRIASRILVRVHDDADLDRATESIACTPGVAYVVTGMEVDADAAAMERAALHVAQEEIRSQRRRTDTFAIEARRSATAYAEPSQEIARRVGEAVRVATGLRVDLDDPDMTVRVMVVQNRTYVCARRVQGVGGLPVGTSGKVVALMSAGIDSPVAAWRIMRRGATIVPIHFSGRPQTPGLSEEYAAAICRVLARGGGLGRLYVVSFGDVQRRIALDTPDDLRVLLYRRMMFRVAEQVARHEGAKALVTGESLGQVASQTLENLACIAAAASLPVLRPLVGSDKQEIITEARRIGTFDLSTASHDDCCTLFMPRRPQTHVHAGQIEAAEALLDIPALTAQAWESVRVEDFGAASYRPPRGDR